MLKQTADQRRIDPVRWTPARSDEKTVRKLAAVLLGDADPAFLKLVKAAAQAAPH